MILTGIARLGRDAEVRYTQGGDAVCSLSLAWSYGKKGQDGNKPAQWLEASLWGKRAESSAPYLTKGALICVVVSDVHIETYQGKNGEGHKLVGRVDDFEFAGGKSEAKEAKPEPKQARSFEDFESDVPFN